MIENSVTKNKRRLLKTNIINFNSEVPNKSQKGVYLRVKANIQCSSMDRAGFMWDWKIGFGIEYTELTCFMLDMNVMFTRVTKSQINWWVKKLKSIDWDSLYINQDYALDLNDDVYIVVNFKHI